MTKQMGFYINTALCTTCKACQIACQDKNNLPMAVRWRRVFQYGGGSWIKDPANPGLVQPVGVFAYSVSIACNHCSNPACLAACPAAAISKDENGLVSIDQTKCVGCRYCEWACPYGTPQFDEARGVMTKCNGCADLVAQGQNPVCVDSCVMRALEFGEIGALRAKYGNTNAIEPLPTGAITDPSIVINPHKHAQLSGTGTGRILNPNEEA
jgi:anaerobic dimethyl sulfoxide reductase subunit B (iron-sulfur subunit)